MGGVIAGAAIAVPAITVAAGVGKIDPEQIDYTSQYPLNSTMELFGTTNPIDFVGFGVWTPVYIRVVNVTRVTLEKGDHINATNMRSANFQSVSLACGEKNASSWVMFGTASGTAAVNTSIFTSAGYTISSTSGVYTSTSPYGCFKLYADGTIEAIGGNSPEPLMSGEIYNNTENGVTPREGCYTIWRRSE